MHHTEEFVNGMDNQAFGLYFDNLQSRGYVGWDGCKYRVSSQMIRLVKERVAIIVLSNSGTGEAYKKKQD